MSLGSIYQRKDGYWVGSVQQDATRKTVYGKTEKEARQKLLEVQKDIATLGGLADPGRRDVNALLDAWLEAIRPNLKPRTVADYESLARRYIRPALGKVKLAKLSPAHVQKLYADLQAKGLDRAPAQVHAALHRCCKLGVLWRWLAENPADRVLPPKYAAARKEVWSADELRAFLAGSQEHAQSPLWTVLASTGLRLGEALALTWESADLDAGRLRVTGNLQRIKGEVVRQTPKTRSGRREVLLPAEGVEALRRQRRQQAEWRLRSGEAWPAEGWVFSGLHGQPLQPSVVEHALTKECTRLGLPKTTPHGFRHLHASLLLDAGLPVPAVSARLGHSRPSITMSTYAHAIAGADRQAAEAMDRALASTPVGRATG